MDLTKNMQVQAKPENQQRQEMWPNSVNYIEHFAFNHALMEEYQSQQYMPYRTPVIFGLYMTEKSSQNNLTFTLISRKDCRRPGRRFLVRGLDKDGNAANFVETEHIFTSTKQGIDIASHVQIRGSIPLTWSMTPNTEWEPPVVVSSNFDESFNAARKHVKETKADYGHQYWVNLIDKKKQQLRIGDAFTHLFKELNDEQLHYVWFDFHGECKNMKWENLRKLIEIVQTQFKAFGYFSAKVTQENNQRTFKVNSSQTGVFRTNCMDCLDRTNVVQSVISRQIGLQQLSSLGLNSAPTGQAFEEFQDKTLEQSFRNLWTDNADRLSILYTGTPALKTDFTRTNKRTKIGALNDGYNSLARYFINNFQDGYNVDCLDLSQKNLNPKSQDVIARPPFNSIKKAGLGLLLLLIFTSQFMDALFPNKSNSVGSLKATLFNIVIYGATLMLGFMTLQKNGNRLIDYPTLKQ